MNSFVADDEPTNRLIIDEALIDYYEVKRVKVCLEESVSYADTSSIVLI